MISHVGAIFEGLTDALFDENEQSFSFSSVSLMCCVDYLEVYHVSMFFCSTSNVSRTREGWQ